MPLYLILKRDLGHLSRLKIKERRTRGTRILLGVPKKRRWKKELLLPPQILLVVVLRIIRDDHIKKKKNKDTTFDRLFVANNPRGSKALPKKLRDNFLARAALRERGRGDDDSGAGNSAV